LFYNTKIDKKIIIAKLLFKKSHNCVIKHKIKENKELKAIFISIKYSFYSKKLAV